MFQIRTIYRGSQKTRENAGYASVVDLRVKTKKVEHPPEPLRIQEKLNARSLARQEEKIERGFERNSAGVLPRTCASLLVGFFLLNPFLDVYADELPLISLPFDEAAATLFATSTPPVLGVATSSPENIVPLTDTENTLSTTTENVLPLPQAAASAEEASSTAEIISPPPVETISSSTTVAVESDTVLLAATTTDETVVANAETDTNADVIADATDTPVVVENTPAPKITDFVPDLIKTDEVKPEPSKTEPVPFPAEAAKEEAATSTPIINVIEHKYLFRENECTRLDDGAFYCLPPEAASSTPSASHTSLPRVFVENDGDKEIFFEDANGKVKITDNNVDDDAPAYDKNSNLLVWQALVNGRFQLMLHDRNSGVTRRLTDTPYNNTDPKIRGKGIVWQGWVNNNWEIFYGDLTIEPFLAQQITTNEQPDMFPMISDNFVTWQSFSGGSWRVFVYNLTNGQTSEISQPEAGKYENPRFALLFENRKENGEVETVGYDVASGKEIPIKAPGTKPASQTPAPQGEKDKAVPAVPSSSGTASASAPMKNPGKDDEGDA